MGKSKSKRMIINRLNLPRKISRQGDRHFEFVYELPKSSTQGSMPLIQPRTYVKNRGQGYIL